MFSQAGRSSNSPLKAGRWRMLQEVVCRFLEVLLQSTKGQKLLGKPFLQTWKTQVWNVNIWMRSHHTNTLGVEHPKKNISHDQGRGDEISLQTKILCTRSFPDVVTQNSRYLSSLVTLKVICTVRSSAWRHNKTLLWTCVRRWSRFKNAEFD